MFARVLPNRHFADDRDMNTSVPDQISDTQWAADTGEKMRSIPCSETTALRRSAKSFSKTLGDRATRQIVLRFVIGERRGSNGRFSACRAASA